MQRLETLFENQNQFFEKHMAQRRENPAPPASKRLPKELLANVRDVYATLTGPDGKELKWNLSMSFSESTNRNVNAAVLDGVRSTDTISPTSTVKAAMRVHFRTKKRQKKILDNNLQNEVLKDQRKRSRKNMKKTKQAKALRESTSIDQTDKEKYAELMAVAYMSSEESLSEPESEGHGGEISGSDDDIPNKKRLCVRPLPWRSNEVNGLMARLDRKIAQRQSQRASNMVMERTVGPASLREAPDYAPGFALASTP
ncbi:uncharacterized protein [Montipora capricornis]|uniref:uncharacterized protein n=1 Tax=Montipora capricornis TaxID=246305 RepID=UPI0035F16B7D